MANGIHAPDGHCFVSLENGNGDFDVPFPECKVVAHGNSPMEPRILVMEEIL